VSTSPEHLLKANLNNRTVSFYQAVHDALGCSIEAVSPQTLREFDAGSNKEMSDHPKFNHQIARFKLDFGREQLVFTFFLPFSRQQWKMASFIPM
jgi:hypothetical protein